MNSDPALTVAKAKKGTATIARPAGKPPSVKPTRPKPTTLASDTRKRNVPFPSDGVSTTASRSSTPRGGCGGSLGREVTSGGRSSRSGDGDALEELVQGSEHFVGVGALIVSSVV